MSQDNLVAEELHTIALEALEILDNLAKRVRALEIITANLGTIEQVKEALAVLKERQPNNEPSI